MESFIQADVVVPTNEEKISSRKRSSDDEALVQRRSKRIRMQNEAKSNPLDEKLKTPLREAETSEKTSTEKQAAEEGHSVQIGKTKYTRNVTKAKNKLALITPPDLSLYAICWVKIKGFKDWPGVIEDYVKGRYKIHFFGDYSTAVVGKSKITNFYEGFGLFNHTFDDIKLKKAINEAGICLMGNSTPTSCLVCSILNSKTRM